VISVWQYRTRAAAALAGGAQTRNAGAFRMGRKATVFRGAWGAASWRGWIMGSLSIWHWLIVLLIVALVFGTKKLRNIGGDLGGAVKGFKEGMRDADAPAGDAQKRELPPNGDTVDVDAKEKTTRSSDAQ